MFPNELFSLKESRATLQIPCYYSKPEGLQLDMAATTDKVIHIMNPEITGAEATNELRFNRRVIQ